MSTGTLITTSRPTGPRTTQPVAAFFRNPLGTAATAWMLIVIAASALAPVLAPFDPVEDSDFANVLSGPSSQHWLGTDSLGRDILSRLMYGGGETLAAVGLATAVAILIGVTFGLLSGYKPGITDSIVTRIVDILLSMPLLVIILVILAVFSNQIYIAMIAMGVLLAPRLVRVVRSATIAVRGELYIDAARVSGLRDWRIIFRHILPRVIGPVIVQGALVAASAVITVTGLAYLGLGQTPPAPSWGGMVAEAGTVISQQPWLLIPAGVTIGLTVLALSLLGDAARDATVGSWASANSLTRKSRKRLTEESARAETVPETSFSPTAVLEVTSVGVSVDGAPPQPITQDVTFRIEPGQILGVVGESGSGKSMTAMAVLGLLPSGTHLAGGSIRFRGQELTSLPSKELSQLRGKEIALISQEPLVSLDPAFTVGSQLGELVRRHRDVSRQEAREIVRSLLADVRLPDPDAVAKKYPHQLSGGMAQRVVIALALAGDPSLLIADEPTTALDVTVQAEILELLRTLRDEHDLTILMVTHNFGVVADLCDRVVVMQHGVVVEEADVQSLFDAPKSAYTRELLDAGLDDCDPREPLNSHRPERVEFA